MSGRQRPQTWYQVTKNGHWLVLPRPVAGDLYPCTSVVTLTDIISEAMLNGWTLFMSAPVCGMVLGGQKQLIISSIITCQK